MLSKGCTCELTRILLKWKDRETLKATTRILKVAVERTNNAKAWGDSRLRFKLFLEDIVDNLEVFSNDSIASKNSRQVLVAQLLVAICSNGVSMQQKDCEEICVNRIPLALEKLLQNQAIKSPLLFTAIYLCYSTLFKIYATEMVLHTQILIENIRKSLLEAIKSSRSAIKESEEYHASSTIILACIKTLLSLTETVPKFLDSYISGIITTLISLNEIQSNLQLALAESIGKNIQAKAVLLGLAENYDAYQRLTSTIQIRNFLSILEFSCKNGTSAYIGANYKSIFDLFLIILPYSEFYYELNKVDHAEIQTIENYILAALSAFIIKLNGHQFKDAFLNFIAWTQKADDSIKDYPFSLRRSIIFIKSITKLAKDVLHNLFVPYLSNYQQFLVEILSTMVSFHRKAEDFNPNVIGFGFLMQLATEHTQIIFEKDTDQVIENESFQIIVTPIIEQIELPKLDKQYIEKVLGPCLVSMIEKINSEEAWKFAFNLILTKARNEDSNVRLSAITIMGQIVNRMQDRLLESLSDIVPSVAECLEDENEEVVVTAKKLLQTFEQITGESIDNYLR